MEKVEPIRSRESLEKMKAILKKKNHRDYLLFIFGCNTALRVGDLVKLRVKDVRLPSGTIRSHITLNEEKTDKFNRLKLPEGLRSELKGYVADMADDDPLFASRKTKAPISTVQAWRIIAGAAQKLDLDKVGTHSMRKSFGYHFYQETKDIGAIQKMMNHSSTEITRRYLGIESDEIDAALGSFEL